MAKQLELEVGDFVSYKGHLMAIIAFHEDQDKYYALCNENHRIVKFNQDSDVKIAMKKGCRSIVAAIFDDMKYYLNNHGGIA